MIRRGRVGPALAVLLLTLAVAAVSGCNGSTTNQAAPPETPATSTRPTQMSPPPGTGEQGTGEQETGEQETGEQYDMARALADCMRKNGAPDFPDPQPDGSFSMDQFAGVDVSALQRIFLESCSQFSLGRH